MLKYKDFSLIKPDGNQCKRILEIINDYEGSIFHEVELNRIVQKNFGSELFYLVDNPKEIDCCTPVHITKNKHGVKRYNCNPLGDIPYAGFVGKNSIDISNLSVGLFESVKYMGFPYPNDRIHISSSIFTRGESTMVNLSLDEDVIFNKVIHSKRRNMIRKALKSDITVKIYEDIKGLAIFWPILKVLHSKLGYSKLTFEYYNEIFMSYVKKRKVFFCIAYKESKPISGIFAMGNTNYMHYYKGASLFDIKNEGHGELLQWEAIKLSKELGVNYYDLCNLDKEKLPDIYRFKTGISHNIIKYPKYTKNSFGYKIVNRIKL